MSMRDTMLTIAREAILHRASLDGYAPNEYDPAEDSEGYVISILIALRHWSDSHALDWQAELARARDLFEEDMQEEQESENVSQNDESARAQSVTREAASKIFDIVCESDWPEQPDAWPEEAILRSLEELRQQQCLEAHTNVPSGGHP
jgi:hypothetical protein